MIPSSRLKIHGVPNEHGEVVVYWMTAHDEVSGITLSSTPSTSPNNTICRWSSLNALRSSTVGRTTESPLSCSRAWWTTERRLRGPA